MLGRVAVLDIAFAGAGSGGGFPKITLPFIEGLGDRLRAWVDHHDHELHASYAADPRFVLATKAEHGACPEMITEELVARVGLIDTIVCHTDFDGLASAAKWMRNGVESYPGCDDDARAIDTRLGTPSAIANRFDRALRARPRDEGLFGLIVRHLATGLKDESLWQPIDRAAEDLIPIERETRRAAERYQRLSPGVAFLELGPEFTRDRQDAAALARPGARAGQRGRRSRQRERGRALRQRAQFRELVQARRRHADARVGAAPALGGGVARAGRGSEPSGSRSLRLKTRVCGRFCGCARAARCSRLPAACRDLGAWPLLRR